MKETVPPTVVMEVRTVGGDEGAALRAAQVKVIHELMEWARGERGGEAERGE